jgi:hypothetical protein
MNRVNSDKETATNSFAISIALHAVALSLFAFVNLSSKQAPVQAANPAMARIKSVSRLIDKAQILPKPKIISLEASKAAKKPQFPLNQAPKPVFGASVEAETIGSLSSENLAVYTAESQTAWFFENSLSETKTIQSLPLENLATYPVEGQTVPFFENSLSEKRLCFVVDCSGSMQGVFERVRLQLKNSISSLEPDRYFQVIFFGDNQLYSFSRNGLVRASGPVKQEALEFIDTIKPKGRTNAVEAMTSAMLNKDSAANSPNVIYFLTDGFNLTQDNDNNLLANTLNFRGNYCNKTRINTIGFWPKAQDEFILRQLAKVTGGTFTLIDK